MPFQDANNSIIDWEGAKSIFSKKKIKLTKEKAENLGIIVPQGNQVVPSNGGVLLFGKDRLKYFPDSLVRCARFGGVDKELIIDELEIIEHLPSSVEPALKFIQRNTQTRIEIGDIAHKKIPQYPPGAVREAVTNAILHADYAMKGATIMIAVFDNRIEITNPGGLIFGLTLKQALAGSSRLRNRVIGKVFKKLQLIEKWGSGLRRIISMCLKAGLPWPSIEATDNEFKITIFGIKEERVPLVEWQENVIKYLKKHSRITTMQASKLFGTSTRTARIRLHELSELGFITRVASSEKDPNAYFILIYDPLKMEEETD